jgi:tellurium resistance protein TerD
MTLNLSKGGSVNLSKEHKNLSLIKCGLGWHIRDKRSQLEPDYDLDFFMIMLDGTGRAANSIDPATGSPTNEKSLIFYNNKRDPTGSVYVGDDNLKGGTDANKYDEEGFVDLAKIPQYVSSIVMGVSIYDYQSRGQNFGQVNGAKCDVFDGKTGERLIHHDLTENMSNGTGVIVATFTKTMNEWTYTAVAQEYMGGMVEIIRKYGLNV